MDMRQYGVEEELMVVGAGSLEPLSIGEKIVAARQSGIQPSGDRDSTMRCGHSLAVELHQEQIEVVSPPVATYHEQLETIRQGRAVADEVARDLGARVVALASPVTSVRPHLSQDERLQQMSDGFGLRPEEQLTCGFHVHVGVESAEEGVQVLDRIRVWLPVLLAMSCNSPFWYGRDSLFSSHRYQSWRRWPTAGPAEIYGCLEEYERRLESLIQPGAALDRAMFYSDARLNGRFSTVEVRIADVCLDARSAAAIAAIVRALVETVARQWHHGAAPIPVGVSQLKAWSWQAARHGLAATLVDPLTCGLRPAREVVGELMLLISQVLSENDEMQPVLEVVLDMLDGRTGCAIQRRAFSTRHRLRDVLDTALRVTHGGSPLEYVARRTLGVSV